MGIKKNKSASGKIKMMGRGKKLSAFFDYVGYKSHYYSAPIT